MLRITKNRFYVVPVLMRALDIVELLCVRNSPLRTNEISTATGVPTATTYRILRTLVQRGYLAQDPEGRFSILNRMETKALAVHHATDDEPTRPYKTDLSGEQVIEIVQSVLQTLRHHHEGSLDQEITNKYPHSVTRSERAG